MSQLAPDEKDLISHRGAAFRALRPVLARLTTLDVPRGTG
jgi:inosine/xanthosine triphosphate pyrophosphatase family protein